MRLGDEFCSLAMSTHFEAVRRAAVTDRNL